VTKITEEKRTVVGSRGQEKGRNGVRRGMEERRWKKQKRKFHC